MCAAMTGTDRTRVVRIIARLNVGGPAGVVPAGEDDMGYFAAAHDVAPHVIPEMSREISPQDAVTVWKLYKLFRRERPDLVHTHTAKAGTLGRVAGFFY